MLPGGKGGRCRKIGIRLIARLGQGFGLNVYPIYTFPATGTHKGPLPVEGVMGSEKLSIEEVLSDSNIVIAMTEYSATAPFIICKGVRITRIHLRLL